MIYKKDINSIINYFQSFVRIIGLSGGIVIFSLSIFFIWFKWFGPGNDPSATFSSEPQGVFLQSPMVFTTENATKVEWIVSVPCQLNEIEFQQEGQAIINSNNWGGGSADCVQEKDKFVCQAGLTDSGLLEGVTYRLQANSSQCIKGEEYVSAVTTFSL